MPNKPPHIVFTQPLPTKGQYKVYSVATSESLGMIKGDNKKRYWEAFDNEGKFLKSAERKKQLMDFFRDIDKKSRMKEGGAVLGSNFDIIIDNKPLIQIFKDDYLETYNVFYYLQEEKIPNELKIILNGKKSLSPQEASAVYQKLLKSNEIGKTFNVEVSEYGKGGGIGERIIVVLDEGNGKVINDLYTQWNNVKSEKDQAEWYEKVKNTTFGTYGTISIKEALDKFDFDKSEKINSVSKEDFKNELNQALKYARGGGIGFKKLSDKVAKNYEGKKVAPKYQHEYGKTYSRAEAKEVGDKVAGKVYWQQQGRMATGGTTAKMDEYIRKNRERQAKEEEGKYFAPYRAFLYEDSYQFADFKTDDFHKAVKWAKETLEAQRAYRKNTESMWAIVDEFTPIEERGNVIYPYKEVARFTEENTKEMKFGNGGNTTFYYDQAKKTLGEHLYNHIASLNKEQLEIHLSHLQKEIERMKANDTEFTKQEFLPKYKQEEKFILYLLERLDEFKYADGGNVEEDQEYYRVFRNNAGKDVAVKILKNPIFGKYDYYVDGSLRGQFDTFAQARQEVNYENFDMYKDGGNIYSKEESLQIARTILQQMGGQNRLVAFTGAYGFAYADGDVSFRIKNRKVNYVKVKLNGKDLYDVTFGRVSGTNFKVVEQLDDVYAEDLIDIFEKSTGMYLRFEKGGKMARGGGIEKKIDKWKKFVLDNKSWFDDESEDVEDNEILLTTRKNGDVGNEEWGREDVNEAKQIVKKIISKFPTSQYKIEQVDEYVYVYLKPSKSEREIQEENEKKKKQTAKLSYEEQIINELGYSKEKTAKVVESLSNYPKEYYEKYKDRKNDYNNAFRVLYTSKQEFNNVKFSNLKEVVDYITNPSFANGLFSKANPIIEVVISLYGWDCIRIKYNTDGFPYKEDGETNYTASRGKTLSIYPFITANIGSSKDLIDNLNKGISDFIKCYEIVVLEGKNKYAKGGGIGNEKKKDIISFDYQTRTFQGDKEPLEDIIRKTFNIERRFPPVLNFDKSAMRLEFREYVSEDELKSEQYKTDLFKKVQAVKSKIEGLYNLSVNYYTNDAESWNNFENSLVITIGEKKNYDEGNTFFAKGGGIEKIEIGTKIQSSSQIYEVLKKSTFGWVLLAENGDKIVKNDYELKQLLDRGTYKIVSSKMARGGGIEEDYIIMYFDDESETGKTYEIGGKKFDNQSDAKDYARSKGYSTEINEFHYGTAYAKGGSVGGYRLADFNPLLDEYDQVVSYKKIGNLKLSQIIGKNHVHERFSFKTEQDRDYWYDVLNEEQKKYFTIKNKKKYLNYILKYNDPYAEKAEDNGITDKDEMLQYFADDIYYELRFHTRREDFLNNLGIKRKMATGGEIFNSEFYKDGGSIDINFATDTNYIKRENIKLVNYKNGKELYNWDYWDSTNTPDNHNGFYSGLYVAKKPLPNTEPDKQYSMFKKGGKLPKSEWEKLPKTAFYINRWDIASVIVYDKKLEEEIEIPANRIVNGIWFDNRRTQMIVDRAKKEGLIPDKTKKTTTFIARFNGKKIELEAKSMFDAEQKALKELKVPKSKKGLLSVMSKQAYERGDFQFN